MLATAGCGFGCGLMICVSCERELCDGGLLSIIWYRRYLMAPRSKNNIPFLDVKG
jgi:hypothetical protein